MAQPKNGLHYCKRVLDARRAVRLRQFAFDLGQMQFLHVTDVKVASENPQRPEQTIPVTLVGNGLLPRLNIVKELIHQISEEHFRPLAAGLLLPFLLRSQFSELPAGSLVVLVEVDTFPVDRCTPEAAGLVEPRFCKTLAWHDEPPKKHEINHVLKGPMWSARDPRSGYFVGIAGRPVDLIVSEHQRKSIPRNYLRESGATGFEPATSASRTRGTKFENARKCLPLSRFRHGSLFTDSMQYSTVTCFSLQ